MEVYIVLIVIVTYPILLILFIRQRKKIKLLKTQNSQPLISNEIHQEQTNDDIYESVGLYSPTYNFSTVDGYKDRLKNIRDRQKEMVKDKKACLSPPNFLMNGSKAQGQQLINDWIKLMLRAFNCECDVIIDHVSFTNFEASKEKIKKNAISLNMIGKMMNISINKSYVDLKIDELTVAFDYQQFKEEEKERLRQIREEEREKAKLEKELQERREKIYKDQKQIATELNALTARLKTATPQQSADIQNRIAELNNYTQKLNNDLHLVEEREQQARAGYVYIISNIGSFGENVYKIGMTRRLEPQDRIDELGGASVPFRFDVHALIFSEDAVSLETALHHEFDRKRVNLINNKREFFNVTLDEIENCVKSHYSKTVEFTRAAIAQEYRQSIDIRKHNFAGYTEPKENYNYKIPQTQESTVSTRRRRTN